jgi:hypothetical protein
MAETESDEPLDLPVVTGERVIPPTEVQWEVSEKDGMPTLRVYNNSRHVGTQIILSQVEAESVADALWEAADSIDN